MVVAVEGAVSPAELTVSELFSETLKIALYGKFGSRKTLQAGYLIDLVGPDNVLIVNAERGLGTIRSKIREKQVITVSTMAEFRAAFLKLREFAEVDQHRWIVIDGMSTVTEMLANDQLSGAERYYDAKAQNRSIQQADLVFGRYLTDKGAIDSMRIYGRIGRDSENLLNALIGLPCNLYVNYLEEMTGTSGYDKVPPLGPDVPGKVGLRAVMSTFDFVGRLSYGPQGELVGGFDSRSNYYMARTREDGTQVDIPKEIANFELGKFVKLVKGELKIEHTERGGC